MVLTARQKDELNRAVAEYLAGAGYSDACEAFCREASTSRDGSAGLLEKKWTSIVRLQKKVMDLETKVSQLEEELKNAAAGGGRLRADTSSKQIPRPPAKHNLAGHRLPVLSVAFHPVFTVVATASEDASIKVWEYESGDLEQTLKGHTNPVNDLDFNPSGTILATCSSDLLEFRADLRVHQDPLRARAQRDRLVSASRDFSIRLWEVATGFCLKTLTGHEDWVRRVVTDRDGLIGTCSTDQTVRVWTAEKGEIATLRGHEHVVEAIAFANPPACELLSKRVGPDVPPTAFIASGSRDNTIRIWHVQTQQCVLELVGHDNWIRGLVFHHTGKMLISASDDRSIRVWDLEHARCTKTIIDAHPHFVSSIALCPRGSHLATGSVDPVVKIWECS